MESLLSDFNLGWGTNLKESNGKLGGKDRETFIGKEEEKNTQSAFLRNGIGGKFRFSSFHFGSFGHINKFPR